MATTGETITALQHNVPLSDLEADANAVRPISAGGTGAATAAAARDSLGLTIGTNVQAFSTKLSAIAALTFAADKMVYATGAATFSTTTLTAFARALLDDTDASTARGTLGAAASATTISAAGLADGGGDLSTNRTITVTEASQAQAEAGTASTVVMTPRRTKEFADSNVYSGGSTSNTDYPIGSIVLVDGAAVSRNQSATIYLSTTDNNRFTTSGATALAGTWRARGRGQFGSSGDCTLFQRVA